MKADTFFLPYQRAWIEDKSRIKIMEKSRQIGMSWTAAYSLVREHSLSGMKLDSWVCSRDEMQARLFLSDCSKFSDIIGAAIADCSAVEVVGESAANYIGFYNGTRIWSLSSNADAQAGKRGTRVLDEFALHPEPERLYSIAYPGITWGGRMEIISTHRGSGNFFKKLVDEARYGGNPKKVSLHRVTLQDALDQGFLDKLKSALPEGHEVRDMDEGDYFDYVKNSCADTESFLQEYMCTPADDSAGFVGYDCISRCCYKPEDGDWRRPAGKMNPLFLGVDVGRSRDLSVFWLLESVGNILYTREISVMSDVPFSQQEAELHRFLRLPNLRCVRIDQSGLGRQFAERAVERYGSARVGGVSFTAGVKEALAYPLKARFEDAKIRIPDDIEIIADIRSVRKEVGAGGTLRFCAERTVDGHADRFWALALAVKAADEATSGAGMELVEKSGANFIW